MKLLYVIDMQNDFIDGVLGTPEAQAIVPKIVETPIIPISAKAIHHNLSSVSIFTIHPPLP